MSRRRPPSNAAPLRRALLATASIIPNPQNARSHPEQQLDRLAASLRRFGQPRPIIVRAANNMLIAGEGIWLAAQRAGLESLDSVIWDCDEKTAQAYMLADNQLPKLAQDDDDRVAALLRQIDPGDFLAVGFGRDEAASIIEGLDDEIEIREIDTAAVADRFWIAIRGPLADQAKALKRLQEAMKDLAAVEVELGTLNVADV